MPRSYVKKLKWWSNHDIKKAVDKVKCGKSLHKAASKCNMSQGKLRQAIKKYEKGIDLSCRSGKKNKSELKEFECFSSRRNSTIRTGTEKIIWRAGIRKNKGTNLQGTSSKTNESWLDSKGHYAKRILRGDKKSRREEEKNNKKDTTTKRSVW